MREILILIIALILQIKAQDNCTSGEVCRDCPELVESWQNGEISLSSLKGKLCGTRKFCCSSQPKTSPTPLPPPTDLCDSDSHCNIPRLEDESCGTHTDLNKIVGGANTKPGRYPFMALIGTTRYTNNGKQVPKWEDWRCGGSIINKWYILTAAHCYTERSYAISEEVVGVGDYDISTRKDCIIKQGSKICLKDRQVISIEKYIAHEKYQNTRTRKGVLYDIALVKLKTMIVYNRDVRPVCLPLGLPEEYKFLKTNNYVEDIEGVKGHVIGWGYTAPSSVNPAKAVITNIQQKVDVPILTKAKCNEEYPKVSFDDKICAGVKGKDSCNGDSGGPLVINAFNKNSGDLITNFEPSVWIQVGIVSFGPRACGESTPGVYTRVENYIGWIRENLE